MSAHPGRSCLSVVSLVRILWQASEATDPTNASPPEGMRRFSVGAFGKDRQYLVGGRLEVLCAAESSYC